MNRFLIITHVNHTKRGNTFLGYAPYIREMNLWLKHVDEVEIIAPLFKRQITEIDIAYEHENIHFSNIPSIQFTSIKATVASFFRLPLIFFKIFKACNRASHIHLRCPGNIGLLGCFVQMFFPKKTKTAKYAGNWDPKSKQPLSYKLQRYLLKNEFLTRNMSALVYGNWNDNSKNIVPFFTASYSDKEKELISNKTLKKKINLLFVGTLSKGKQPLVSVKTALKLFEAGFDVTLDIYGEGIERKTIDDYINAHNLNDVIMLHGNKDRSIVKEAYKKAHFLVFISKSEGWPKVVAEAMFWKCLPISTSVSCVPDMLDFGERGSIVAPDIEKITSEIKNYIINEDVYQRKIEKAYNWSRDFTLDTFEAEIKKLLI